MVLERVRQVADSGLPWFWLDGGSGEPGYLGVASEVRIAERGKEREFLASLRRGGAPSNGRFASGWVVALGYEFGVGLLGLDPAVDNVPPGFALRVDRVFNAPLDAGEANVQWPRPAGETRFETEPRWRRTAAEYEAQVNACKAAIHDGEAYVLCLTDTAEVLGNCDPLALYARLRDRGAALRGGVIVAGDRALVSASPERFLSVRGGRIVTHPIKGTRPRSSDPAQDAALARELASDPKERAENLMIVDLMRNDLSRACDPGTVAVEGFLRVEAHPHVHQLVSTVTGRLTAGSDVFDAIEACFPGGSMTGAPKHRSVELLGQLEQAPRGLYSGCFGWIDDSGDAELAMTIRGAELRGIGTSRARALVGAGGGITSDSDPAQEHAEKQLKAEAVLTALAEHTHR